MLILIFLNFIESKPRFEKGCSFVGGKDVKPYSGPPFPPDGSLNDCSRYQHQNVCCTSNETLYFKEKFKIAMSIFGVCPACYNNLLTTWCDFDCSPYQKNFVKVFQDSEGKIINRTFIMCSKWAKGVYESCMWVNMVREMWKTYEVFWEEIASMTPVIMKFDDKDPNSYCPDILEKCEDSCGCLVCPPACTGKSNSLKYNKDVVNKKIGGISSFKFWIILLSCIFGVMIVSILFSRIKYLRSGGERRIPLYT